MNSSFGKQLFRVFLLFALIPSILLAIAGYYLALETLNLSSTGKPSGSTQVVDYYNRLLFDRAAAALKADAIMPTGIDFLIQSCNGQITQRGQSEILPNRAAARILEAAADQTEGFVVEGVSVYQYSSSRESDSCYRIAGFVHASDYQEMISRLQTDRASAISWQELLLSYGSFLTVLFIALALTTLIGAWYFSRRIASSLSRPVAALTESSRMIASGDYGQQVEVTSTGEIQILIDSFNSMARQLENTTTRLAQSERVAAWRHVARRFAHELKNPLQPITISIYRIEKALLQSPSFESVREPLRAAAEELKHLTKLAERFSNLAKLPPPKLEQVSLNDLLKSIAELYKNQLSQYNFELLLPDQPVEFWIDTTYFREALHNLLQNAIDACKTGDKISLELKTVGSTVEISVRDSGAGMTQEILDSARMPYFTTRKEGNGLGLAIVEKTAEELGGQVLIKSRPAHGTSVTIVLPEHNKDEQ